MHPEAAFLAGYSLALMFVSIGVESLGRHSTDPWASRTLAASKRPAARPSPARPQWLHSEVPIFHLGISAVVLAASFILTALSAALYPGPTELITDTTLLVIVAIRIRHLALRHRILRRRAPHDPRRLQIDR